MLSDEKGYHLALAREEECCDHIRMLIGCACGGCEGDEVLVLEKAIRACVTPGFYEHFKSKEDSRKFYEVAGVSIPVNRPKIDNFVVVYRALYGSRREMSHRELVGKDSFLLPVNRPAYIGPRFRKLSEDEIKQFALHLI